MSKISSQEQVDFANNLAIMLKSGITVNEALGSLAEQAKSARFKKILQRIKSKAEKGTSLSEAFWEEKGAFGGVFVSLIKAGETSGTLEDNLLFVADWLERNNDLKREMNAAMLYPKIVLAATFLLGGGLTVFILPRLAPLFQNLRVALPITTRILMAVSLFVQEFWLAVFFGIAGVIVAFTMLKRIRTVKRFLHLIYIKTPFLGNLMVCYELALISKLLSTMFKSGVSIAESLNVTSEAVLNLRYRESIEKMRERVLSGTPLAAAMEEYRGLYPKNFISIVSVGEKSGTIENSFEHLTEFYSKEVSNKTKKLPTIIEPLLLIFIGIIVGFVAMSIIMPIYEITRSFSQ